MQTKLNNAKALYMEGIRDGNAREAVEKYTGDRYTQHSTGVRDGVEGFVEFFEEFLKRNPIRDIDIIRGWEDGQYVFVHAYQNINNGEAEWVTTDFFDTDKDDKIIEHWDIIAPYRTSDSGRSVVDGPDEVTDVQSTSQNKAVVREMIEQVFMKSGDANRAQEFVADDCIQHNPDFHDGLDAFQQWATAPDRSLWYSEIVLLVGRGNFVATLCKAARAGNPIAQCDIFRLDKSKIVEHWDNTETIGPEKDWVNSGKF